MIDCRFIYGFKSSGASDSVIRDCKVHTVPRVGDTIHFIGDSGIDAMSEVKEVNHTFSTDENTHDIVVYHGDK